MDSKVIFQAAVGNVEMVVLSSTLKPVLEETLTPGRRAESHASFTTPFRHLRQVRRIAHSPLV